MRVDREPVTSSRSRWCAALVICALILQPCVTAGTDTRSRSDAAHPAAQTPGTHKIVHRNAVPGIDYVGSKACAVCHAAIYDSYIKTDMGRSMSLPNDPGQLAKVASAVTVHSEKPNRFFQVMREGSGLYQSEYEVDSDGREVFRDTQRIEYGIGADANGTSHIVRRGDYLFEAPLSYYAKAGKWDLSPGYEQGDPGFSRPIAAACIMCHSGLPQPVQGRDGLYKDPPFRELAIGCENCHGPGQLHVQERMKGTPVSGEADAAIVNPKRLPGWLADNICMNCHQGGDTRVLQPGKDYLDFRPGTPLDYTVVIFAVPFRRESPPSSPLLQHYTLMALSRCYLSSSGKLGCISCHDPHREPSPAEAPDYYRAKCLACHSEENCTLSLSSRRAKSPPDDCAGCHMPKQNLGVIAHSALTNHRIIAREGEPFPETAFRQTTPGLQDLVHVNAIPGDKSPIPPLTLFKAYGDLATTYPAYKDRLQALLKEVAPTKHDDPLVLSALARETAMGGTAEATSAAIQYLSRAIQLGSTLAADFEALADLLARSGKTQEPIDVLKRGIELNPYSSRLYKALALHYISVRQYGDALAVMKKELDLFPEDSLMRMLVKKAEAGSK